MLLLKAESGELLAELDKQRTSLGRDPANEVVLTDPSVSGFHAVILNDRGTVSVVDVGSTNGTSVDGKRLAGRTDLPAWSTLQLGAVTLKIEDSEGRAPTVLQPAVPGREGAAVAQTSVRPAACGDATRVTPAAAPGGATRVTPAAAPGDATRVTPAAAPGDAVRVTPAAASGGVERVTPAAAPGGGAGSSVAPPVADRTEVLPGPERGGGSGTVASPAAKSPGEGWANRPVQSPPPRGGIRFEPLQPPSNRPGHGGSASPGGGGTVPPVAAGGVGVGASGAGAGPPPAGAVPPPATRRSGAVGADAAVGTSAGPSDFALSGAYPRGLKWLLFSFKGRINRKTFWLTNLTLFVVGMFVNGFLAAVGGGGLLVAGMADSPGAALASLGLSSLLYVPWGVASAWTGLAVVVKRLHDSGRRLRPWVIWWLAPLVGQLPLLAIGMSLNSEEGAVALVILLLGLLLSLFSLGVIGVFVYVVGFVKSDGHVNEYGDPNPATMVVAYRW